MMKLLGVSYTHVIIMLFTNIMSSVEGNALQVT